MNFKWTKESLETIHVLRQQDYKGPVSGVLDHVEMPDTGSALAMVTERMRIFLRVTTQPKSSLELSANKNCTACDGKGSIRYWYAQDESTVAPCHQCFPTSILAQAAWTHYKQYGPR